MPGPVDGGETRPCPPRGSARRDALHARLAEDPPAGRGRRARAGRPRAGARPHAGRTGRALAALGLAFLGGRALGPAPAAAQAPVPEHPPIAAEPCATAAGDPRDRPCPNRVGPGARVEREAYVMGTVLRARVVAADRETAIRASEAALAAVRRTEALLSTWLPDTELARLDAAPVGRTVPVSRSLLDLLVEVETWSRRTGGAFDPAVGSLIEAWDLRGAGRRPDAEELGRALTASGFRCFELDREAGTVRPLCPGAWLDAGAFGKGAALREARRALEAAGARAALVDFGGQILAFGDAGENGRTVEVAHPSRRAEPVLRLRLPEGSVATTGQSERSAGTESDRIGHVLDPRTGRPVPAWGSVSVVAEDPLVADLLSTALFVMGPDRGLAWLEGRDGIASVFLIEGEHGLAVRASEAMRALLVADGAEELVEEARRDARAGWGWNPGR